MEMQVQVSSDFENELKAKFVAIASDALNSLASRPQFPEWMTLGDTADYLSISRGTLTTWIHQGLKVTIVGSTKRIRKSDADTFMTEHSL
jgi:excisionase family DNA binding protein